MSGGSKKKSGSKKGGSTKGDNASNNNGNESNVDNSNPLIRPTTNHTINPRGILTGFYQKNGKRVQHTVHDGALQMPKDALNVIETATAKLTAGAGVQSTPAYELPGLDSVVRPCLDPKLETIIVTELVMEKVQIPQSQPAAIPAVGGTSGIPGAPAFPPMAPPVVKMIKTSRPAAKNRLIRRIRSSAVKGKSGTTTAAERIRGGGDVPMTGAQQQQPQQKEPETVFNVPAATAPVQPPAIAQVQPATSATVQPSAVTQSTETPGAASDPQNTNSQAKNDIPMAPAPQVPQDKMPTVDTSVTPGAATIPKAVESTTDNSKNIPLPNVGESQPPAATDVKLAADTTSGSNLPKDGAIPTAKGTGGPITGILAPGSSIPPSANTTNSSSGLAAKESGGDELPQQQSKPFGTAAIATTTASTDTLMSDKATEVAGGSTKIEGNSVATENPSAQIKPTPMVQTQGNLPSTGISAKTSEVNTSSATTATSAAVVSTGPTATPAAAVSTGPTPPTSTAPTTATPTSAAPTSSAPASTAPTSTVATAVVSTVSSGGARSITSSVVKNVSGAPSSGVATAAANAPQTTPAIPVVTSSTPATKPAMPKVKVEEKKPEEVPEAKVLQSKPPPQWEQHKPGPNDETISPENQLPPMPDWYKKDGINEIERSMLPEWFDSSSSHRTPQTYIKAREKVIEMSVALSNRNVTNSMIRRSIVGDAGSLQRLRQFLVNWGIINRDGMNDSAPTTASLRPSLKRSAKFTDDMRDRLITAVTGQASKKRKLAASSSSTTSLSLDWEEIASQVGFGVSAENCRESFMTAPLQEDSSTAMDVTEGVNRIPQEGVKPGKSQEEFIQNLVGNTSPEVLKKVFDAAIEATDFNSVETRAASLLGLELTTAIENARGHEIDLALRLSKLLDTRMQKLENRMAMLDDVEGILEAEKVALEMERRDLYTARCRHWFGGV